MSVIASVTSARRITGDHSGLLAMAPIGVGALAVPESSWGLGSRDPVQAAAAQVLVLIGLLTAEAVAVVITVELVARRHIRRAEPAARRWLRGIRWRRVSAG